MAFDLKRVLEDHEAASDDSPQSLGFMSFDPDLYLVIYRRPANTLMLAGTVVGRHVDCRRADSSVLVSAAPRSGKWLTCGCGQVNIRLPNAQTFKTLVDHLTEVLDSV